MKQSPSISKAQMCIELQQWRRYSHLAWAFFWADETKNPNDICVWVNLFLAAESGEI